MNNMFLRPFERTTIEGEAIIPFLVLAGIIVDVYNGQDHPGLKYVVGENLVRLSMNLKLGYLITPLSRDPKHGGI
jgi:hypothetical protein